MLTPELNLLLNSVGARLRATKFKNRAQLVDMKKALNELLDPQIKALDIKTRAANEKKQKDRAEKEAYRDKFRESWVASNLPVNATVLTAARKAYIVLAIKDGSVILTDPTRNITTETMSKNIMKVLGEDGKFLDIYSIAAQDEQPKLKITEPVYG